VEIIEGAWKNPERIKSFSPALPDAIGNAGFVWRENFLATDETRNFNRSK
jgi:hypothetical protein